MKLRSLVFVLSSLVGFALGAVVLGYAAWLIGMLFLSHVAAGIHSDWATVVVLGTLACFGLGGVAGAVGALRLAKSLRSNGDL